MITKQKKTDYVQCNWQLCPHCGSKELSMGQPGGDHNQMWVNVYCRGCQKGWEDIYTLTGIEDEDDK